MSSEGTLNAWTLAGYYVCVGKSREAEGEFSRRDVDVDCVCGGRKGFFEIPREK